MNLIIYFYHFVIKISTEMENKPASKPVKLALLKKLVRFEALTRIEKSLLKASLIIGLGGFMYGYDISIVAGGIEKMNDHFNFSTMDIALIVSFLSIGGAFGACFAGPLCDSIGRWKTCQVQAFLFILGSFFIVASQQLSTILLGRLIIGIGTSFAIVGSVPYLNEISPVNYRGRFQGGFEVSVSLGMVVSTIVNILSNSYSQSWRFTFSIPILIAGLQSLLLFLLPESPSFLVQKGKFDEAYRALDKIYRDPDTVQMELSSLRVANIAKATGKFETFFRVVKSFSVSLLFIIGLIVCQSLGGAVVISSYAPWMLSKVGFNLGLSLMMTLVFGFVRLGFTIIALLRIDSKRWGRRLLLSNGIIAMIVGYIALILTLYFYYHGTDTSTSRYFFLPSISVIVGGHGFGLGPVSRVLQAEMFPTLIRSRGLSITLFVQCIVQFAVLFSFPLLTDKIQETGIFAGYAILTIFALIYVRMMLPETLGRDPTQIQNELIVGLQKHGCLKGAFRDSPNEAIIDLGLPINNIYMEETVQMEPNEAYVPPVINAIHNRQSVDRPSNTSRISRDHRKTSAHRTTSTDEMWMEMRDTDEYFA